VFISGGGVNPFSELKSVANLYSIFRLHEIDLVLSYTPKGNLYSGLACLLSGRTFVPNVSGLGRAFVKQSAVTYVARLLYRISFQKAAHAFFQNEEDMSLFVKEGFITRGRAERLPGSGVDLNRFSLVIPMSHQRAEPGAGPVFLLVARMLWDKGIGEYVSAAREVRKHYPAVRFQLLGQAGVDNPSAVHPSEIKAWAEEGVVEYLGSVEDVRPFMVAADCVVLPSYREGVPRSLLEAAALGKPIVTTDAIGCRDTVIDGESGYLCRVKDASDLAAKLLKVIELPNSEREAMGQRGRKYMETSFDERIVLNKYLNIIAAVANAQFAEETAAFENAAALDENPQLETRV
jgi:glycosyltransferase involved in cell wall biosynthesis